MDGSPPIPISPTDDSQDAVEQAYGAIIRAWASLETLLVLYLQTFSGMNNYKARIAWATLPNFQARKRLLNRYAENYLEGQTLRKYQAIMKRTGRLAEKRNMIAHSPSAYSPKDKQVYFMRLDRDNGEGNTFVFHENHWETLNNVRNWSRAIQRLVKDAMALRSELHRQLLTSPKMYREPPERHNTPRGRSRLRKVATTPAKRLAQRAASQE